MVISKYFNDYTDPESQFAYIIRKFREKKAKIFNLNNRLKRKSVIKDYYRKNKQINIQFACGRIELPDFLNTELTGRVPVDISKKLPFPSNSVDIVFDSHVIEHLYYRHFLFFLKESYRILKKGGIHIIMTPSLKYLFDALYNKNGFREILFKSPELMFRHKLDPATFLNRYMHIYYGHRFIYDYETINRLAKLTGYSNIKKIEIDEIPIESIRKAYQDENGNFTKQRFLISNITCLLTK